MNEGYVRRRKREWLTLEAIAEARRFCGVYVMYHEGAVVYIGHAADIGDRLVHHRKRFPFDGVKVCQVLRKHNRKILERKLLFRLRPKHNTFIPPMAGVSVAMHVAWR